MYSNSALWPQRERPSCTLDAVKGLRAFPTLAQIGATDAYNLWYLPIDPSTGHRAGDPVQLSHSDGSYVALVGLSRDGKRLAVFKNHIWSGAVLAKLSKNNELSGEPFQLTHSGSQNFAKWQTDSKGLILSSNRSGRLQLYIQKLGEEKADPLVTGAEDYSGGVYTPDGQFILFFATPTTNVSAESIKQTIMRIRLAEEPFSRSLKYRETSPRRLTARAKLPPIA